MKLNPDCIRDVLIWLEDNLKIEGTTFSTVYLYDLKTGLPQYSEEELYYTIYNLFQIEYVEGKISLLPSHSMHYCEIMNITWSGHEFLNTIRPKSIWDATKLGAKKLGLMSISSLNTIAHEIAMTVVTHKDVIDGIIDVCELPTTYRSGGFLINIQNGTSLLRLSP